MAFSPALLGETFGQLALLGGSAGGTFAIIRWGIQWISGRHDRRQAQLDLQEEKIDREWQGIRVTLADRVAALEKQLRAVLRSYQHVAGALIRRDPGAAELIEAEQIMAQAFPLDLDVAAARAEAALDRDFQRRQGVGK